MSVVRVHWRLASILLREGDTDLMALRPMGEGQLAYRHSLGLSPDIPQHGKNFMQDLRVVTGHRHRFLEEIHKLAME